MIMSRVIAAPGTFHRLSRPSCLTVRPSFEMPYSARLPSAVAVFIEMTKLAQMTIDEEVGQVRTDEVVEGADVVERLHGLRADTAGEGDGHHRVHEEDEERRRHQRLPRIRPVSLYSGAKVAAASGAVDQIMIQIQTRAICKPPQASPGH